MNPNFGVQNSFLCIWVTDEREARDFYVTPGCSQIMLNRNGQELYLKASNRIGGESFQIYDLARREMPEPEEEPAQVTRAEFEAQGAAIQQILALLQGKDGK